MTLNGTLIYSKTVTKINPDRAREAQAALTKLLAQLAVANQKPNKTPDDKDLIEKLKNAIKRARDRLKASEEHARTGQGY
jgi:CRISPR/Cas system CSM-associated protein Csm2 small subunit